MPPTPIHFTSLGHINVVVDVLDAASTYYQSLFGAIPLQEFPHFRNRGFALSAGFLDDPDSVDVSIQFLQIPGAGVILELMEYHQPRDLRRSEQRETYALGGPRHIALRVREIDAAFAHVRAHPDTRMIHSSPAYRPQKIDRIQPENFRFFDLEKEADSVAKADVCEIVGSIRYFYFIDRYGVQWELEQGHDDMGSESQ